MPSDETRDADLGTRLVLAAVALGSLLNALWMLFMPRHWYDYVPADASDFGPYNHHFVKDFGDAFLTVGLMLAWAWREPRLRAPLTLLASVFYVVHALIHAHDTGLGLVDAHHWLLDVPLVYLPAILLLGVLARLWGGQRGSREPPHAANGGLG